MSRLLKKCIFLSIGLHVLVAALLIAAAAFFITKPDKVQPTLSMIAPEVLDNILNPKPVRSATIKSAPTVRRNVVPQPPKPVQPKKVVPTPPRKSRETPTPKKPTPRPKPKNPSKPKPAPPPKIRIAKSTKTVGANSPKPVATQAPVRPKVDSSKLTGKVNNLRSQLSAGIKVNVSGANAAAFTSYAQYVVSVYRRTWQPLIPKNLTRTRVAVVEVTIDRTGRVLGSRITRKTGDAALDRSVQSALDRVKTIGKAFPAGSKDSKRTFTLDFTPRIRG
jgi:TonB family protein